MRPSGLPTPIVPTIVPPYVFEELARLSPNRWPGLAERAQGNLVAAAAVRLERVEARPTSPDVVWDATAFQWQWQFELKDEGLSWTGAGKNGPEMVVPVNETVLVKLHAQDVIHAFYVPAFFYKKDAIPGYINELWFTAEKPGTYRGQCVELCGRDHGFMPVVVEVKTKKDFDAWLAEKQQAAAVAANPTITASL